ncbi:MAG: universal stress protein [Pseudomonadota bacterium]|nr:universal stress protein [Pseudomonadota bacterium]
MTQAKTLLAATDFSTPARHALERAALLAQAHPDARLTLAHVISRSALDNLRRLFSQDAAALEAKLLEQAQCSLSELAQHLAASHACAIDTVLKQGSAPTSLVELAEDQQTDLLVMGARGAHFVRERLLGSTTERVLRTSRRPLLAVKQRPHAPYRRILAPVDFSDHAATAINAAHAWLPDADIVLLHAFEVEMESALQLAGITDSQIHQYRIQARAAAQQAMDAFIDRLQVPENRLSRQFVHGAATLRILEHEQIMDADLIVMGKHGQSALEELLLGSVTQHVLMHSSSDVFIAGQPV